MDEDLKALLDEARQGGANEDQLSNIVDLYNKKKSQGGSGGTGDGTGSAVGSTDGSEGTFLKPNTSGQAYKAPDLETAVSEDNLFDPTKNQEYKPEPAQPNEPGFTMGSIGGAFNLGISHLTDAISGLQKIAIAEDPNKRMDDFMSNITGKKFDNDPKQYKDGSFSGDVKSYFADIMNMARGSMIPGVMNPEIAKKFAGYGDDLSGDLKEGAKNNPLPDTFAGKATGAVLELTPTVLAAMATGGGSAEGELYAGIGSKAGGYLATNEILQASLAKAASPLVGYLATQKSLEGANTAYNQSGGNAGATLTGAALGGQEGVMEGLSLETQMAAGGQIGKVLFGQMVKWGLATEDGAITEQALKSFVGSPFVFGSSSVADDLAHGREIDWKNAGVNAATALPFELPHIFEAYAVSKNISASKEGLDKAINQAVAVRDNNATANFLYSSPGDIVKAMQRPESSQELQVMALKKGMDAADAKTYQDKNTLHLEQMDLQNQADLKKIGEVIVDKGIQGFVEAVNHTELPEATKEAFLNKANAVNSAFSPVELQKNEIGQNIMALNDRIGELKNTITNTADQAERQQHYVTMNDMVAQNVKAQTDIFNLTYGDQQHQQKGVAIANIIAANPVLDPGQVAPAKTFVPVDNEFLSGAHITDITPNGDVVVRQKDGKEETISNDDRKALNISDELIQKFKDANPPTTGLSANNKLKDIEKRRMDELGASDESTHDEINRRYDDEKNAVHPTTISTPQINPERQPGETEFEHKVRIADDPNQLASMYADKINDLQTSLGVDGAIADYNNRFSREHFDKFGDRNSITPAIARNYFTRKGEKGLGMDIQAMEINDIYFNGSDVVQPEDIYDFAVRYPAGHNSYFTPAGNDELSAINNRYREITGKNLRKDIARNLAAKYNVSNADAVKAANVIDSPHTDEVISTRIEDLLHTEGQFTGQPDYSKISEELDRYMSDPKNEWNIWHPVFEGRKPEQEEFNLTERIIDEHARKQGGETEGTDQEPFTGNENSPSNAAFEEPVTGETDEEEAGTAEVTDTGDAQTSLSEPERVAKEYDDQITETDDKISRAESSLQNAASSINDANDLFASSGSTDDGKKSDALFKENANVSPENVERILKPLRDAVDRLKQDKVKLLSDKEKAVEQASRQTVLPDAQLSRGPETEIMNPEHIEVVKKAMNVLFPNVRTEYYPSAAEFDKALKEQTGIDPQYDGNITHGFVDANYVQHFNPEYLQNDTQLHENGHILMAWAKVNSPELYQRMIQAGAVMQDIHTELRQNGYKLSGVPLYEEAFNTTLGREGAKRLDEVVDRQGSMNRVQRLVHEAWTKLERWIAGKTGFSLSKFQNIRNMDVNEFLDYINDKYQLSDVKISDMSSEDIKEKSGYTDPLKSQTGSDIPERKAGESLSDYAKRVADAMDDAHETETHGQETPPGEIVGDTNGTKVFGKSFDLGPETGKEATVRKGQDYMNRVKVAEDAIRSVGGNIDESNDFYNHNRRVAALAEHAVDVAREAIYKSPDKKNPSLFEQMKKDGVSDTDLGLYLYAKHAEERNRENANTRQMAYEAELERVQRRHQEAVDAGNKKNETYFKNKIDILEGNQNVKYPLMPDGGSGMTNAQAKEILDRFETEGKSEKLGELAERFYNDVTRKQLRNDVESGRISQEDADNLMAKYKNYVPLQVKDHVDAKKAGSTVSGLLKVKDAFRRAKGAAARDFNQRVNPLHYGVVQLEKSIIEGEKNKLLNTFKNLIEENPNPDVWEVIQPRYKATYKADGTVDKIDNITDEKIKNNSLYGFDQGRPFYLHVKDDIMRRAVTKEGLNYGSLKRVISGMQAVQGFFRNGLTVYNPAFWVPNFAKDNFSAQYNLNAQGVKGIVGKFESKIPSSMQAVFKYERGERGTDAVKPYEDYLQSGAKLTYSRYDMDVEKLEKLSDYFNKLDKSNYNPAQMVKNLGHFMENSSELFELTTRVAAYNAAVESGVAPHEAAIMSKEATVDFSQKGEWTPLFNSLYMFSNAGVQGAQTFFSNLAKNPKAAGKVLAGMIAFGVFTAALNNMTNGTPNPNGQDDADDYNRISENDKQGNIIIRNFAGHGFIKIPIGHELGVFGYMGDKIYNVISGKVKPGAASLDVAKYSLNTYSPIQGGDLAQTLSPTLLDPVIQMEENKNAFGNPIYKKTDDNSIVPQSLSHFSNTAQLYVDISHWLHKATGGTGAKNGVIELPPDVIPWAIQTVTGGAGRTTTQTVDAVANSVMLKPTEVKDIPVLYRFYTTGRDKNYRSNVIGLLDKSGTEEVTNEERQVFFQDAMKAVLKGEIDDKAYNRYITTFMNNQERMDLSKRFPNASPDDLKNMMAK